MNTGTLFVVATPIGNLADASSRSLEVLASAAIVACEDTRTTGTLLARHAIRSKTIALHEHNEREATRKLIAALERGEDVALVSDAGTPAISDPGAWLVQEAHRVGIRVSPIPGPNAAVAALAASGFPGSAFLFIGFLPATRSARRKALESLEVAWPLVLYEAPHRVAETLEDLARRFGTEREICIAREITKKFEEIARLALGEATQWLTAEPHRGQGEFVLVVGPGQPKPGQALDMRRLLSALAGALPPSEAAKVAARITGLPKGTLYREILEYSK